MVDVDTDQASVRGQAKFIWRSTGKSWQDGMGEHDHLLIGAEATTWGMALSHPHISPGEFEVDNFGLPPFQEMWAQNRQNWMELVTWLWNLQDLSPFSGCFLDQHTIHPLNRIMLCPQNTS